MLYKKARIKDIAITAGVSIGTVDRVLHERGEVAQNTREKVLKIAKDLEYSPNFLARALKATKNLHIVSLLPEPDEDNTFWIKHSHGLQKALQEFDSFPIRLSQISYNMLSEKQFRNCAERILEMNPDGVIMAPLFKNESTELCNQLAGKNIPYVFLDGYLENVNFLSYTGEDIFRSGRVAAQLADLITPPGKEILILNLVKNLKNTQHLKSRTEGFLSYFSHAGTGNRKIINQTISNPVPEIIEKDTGIILKKNPSISTIFITSSKSYKIADYVMSQGINYLKIIGYDLLEKNVEYLKRGYISFLIGQRPEEQAFTSIKKLFDYLSQDKKPRKMEFIPVDIVTSENVDFFI